MSSEELFATLTYLAANRLLGIEADAKLDPFRDQHLDLGLIFDSSSRTIGTRFDRAYEQGYTVICKLEEDDTLEVTVLMLPEDNDKVDALATGDTFEAKLKVLDYDSLYQRPVFGQALEEDDAPEQEEEPSEPTTEAITPEEPDQQPELAPQPKPEPSPAPISQPEPAPAPAPAPKPEPQPLPELPATKPPPPRPKRKKAVKPKLTRSDSKEKNPRLRRIKKLKDKLSMARSKECPNGHGPIKNRFGLMQCAVCGWSPKTTLKGLPEPSGDDEEVGCVGLAKMGFWLFILFCAIKACS